jgi:hypothetical protein
LQGSTGALQEAFVCHQNVPYFFRSPHIYRSRHDARQ